MANRATRYGLVAAAVIGVMAGIYYVVETDRPLFGLLQGQAQGQGGGPGRGPQGPVPVETATVQPEAVPIVRRYTGTTVARRGIDVRARVTGYLVERNFEEGGVVEEGQALYRIDPRPFENAIDRLTAERDAVQANLNFLQKEVERIQTLEDEEFASESRLDELVSQREQAAANVRRLEAQIADARLNLEFSTITAAFSGRIGFSRAEVGDLVTAGGDPLTDLRQLDPMLVRFEPSDDDLPLIQRRRRENPEGVAVQLQFDDGGYYPQEGTLSELENELSPTTGTITARATVPNPERRLLPGQFARVRMILGEEERLLVPTTALVTNQDQRGLYVFEDGKARLRVVRTGRVRGERTEIAEGIDAGAEVIVSNLQRLRDGANVVRSGGPERDGSPSG